MTEIDDVLANNGRQLLLDCFLNIVILRQSITAFNTKASKTEAELQISGTKQIMAIKRG